MLQVNEVRKDVYNLLIGLGLPVYTGIINKELALTENYIKIGEITDEEQSFFQDCEHSDLTILVEIVFNYKSFGSWIDVDDIAIQVDQILRNSTFVVARIASNQLEELTEESTVQLRRLLRYRLLK